MIEYVFKKEHRYNIFGLMLRIHDRIKDLYIIGQDEMISEGKEAILCLL